MISNGFFHYLLIPLMFFGFALSGVAQETAKPVQSASSGSDSLFICKKDRVVRWLRSHKLESGKCITTYSKGGFLQIVGSASYYSSCEGILNGVKKNLEESGYLCSQSQNHSVIEL